MTATLFDYHRSSASYRVRIALNLKGIVWDRVAVNLLTGEQRAPANLSRNPQGQVPTLDIDGHRFTQSLAIIDYLDATRPDPALVPGDPVARARVLAQALVVAADTHPIGNLSIIARLESQFGADAEAKDAWRRFGMKRGLDALEAMVAGDRQAGGATGPFLGGDAPNLADICLVPQLYNARRFDLPLDDYPHLVRADAAANALDAFAAAHPDQFS